MHFVVAFDASKQSKSALKSALQMAQNTDARVTVLHSIQKHVRETTTGDGYPIIEGLTEAEERSERVLNIARDIAEDFDAEIETDVTYGEPVSSLLDFATAKDASAIFVGHRGHADKRPMSVTKGLIEQSHVPITVVS